jgi:hypothetical protein
VPNDDLNGAGEGDKVWVDLRNPKTFLARAGDTEPDEVPSST